MNNKYLSVLFSTKLMAFLFILFAVAMAAGTFIENDYNTDTARIWVYNAWWFEVIMVFFVINFIGNISRYQLYKKEKWATLLLHLSFLFILVGAFITRYISYEGMMPIREGAVENQMYSDKVYLTAFVDGDLNGEMKRRILEKPLILSPVTNNHFNINDRFDKLDFKIEYVDFLMNAQETIVADDQGIEYLKIVESSTDTRNEFYLKAGEVSNVSNVLFAFNAPTPGAINITKNGDAYTMESAFGGDFMRMADQQTGNVFKDSLQPLAFRSLYNVAGMQFVFPEPAIKGIKKYEGNLDFQDKQSNDALVVKVTTANESKTVTLIGSKGQMGVPQSFSIGALDFTLFFGSKVYTLPFSVRLNKFIADTYPGSSSFSAFESQVTVINEVENETFDARIYMNNVLDYKGYRFFQASYYPDLKGTYLSVNYDFWGTWITYIGYFLLYFAMMAILFDKNTRFADLKAKLAKVKAKKAALLLVPFLMFFGEIQGQNHSLTQQKMDSIIEFHKVPKAHADAFGALVIQDDGGRMKPVNTFASELLRKVSKSETYKGLNADQVFLSISQYPRFWFEVPLIYLKRGNDSLRSTIGVSKDAKYAPFISFFDAQGHYKLSPLLDKAYQSAIPNQFEKDFIETDKKVLLLNAALSGRILKIFPIPGDENNKWASPLELNEANFRGEEADFVSKILPLYFESLASAKINEDYSTPDQLLQGMKDFQKKFGAAVIPSDQKIKSEILYNKFDVFKRLFSWYMYAGVLMLLLTILQIFLNHKMLKTTINGLHWLIGLFFGLHTLGLIARWYVSGHAPWSDAYESMIYVAWAVMFFGLSFDKKSKLTVASATFVTAMILMIAHWSWMDPAISNLQPVLNSYWLMIHVAVIVASYGPFALGMILGIVALILILLTNTDNHKKMKLNIQEITYINEMALTVGLVMLTIGNFLGGQWANESWGRYWGWDPKETWALISIMVYAFVIHMRFVPFLRGLWVYNVASIYAFYAILMTYFGVNFYLSGLHSYASGDKVVTPSFVYISFALISTLSFAAYFKYKKFYKTKKQ